MQLSVSGSCWQHVHPHEGNVIDATYWSTVHPGGIDKIEKFASVDATTSLSFPASHDMARWRDKAKRMSVLGKLGDTVSFNSLPSTLRTSTAAQRLGAAALGPTQTPFACGTHGEVATETARGYRHYVRVNKYYKSADGLGQLGLQKPLGRDETVPSVWFMAALEGKDQLRLRMAWALSQILVVSRGGAFQDAQEPYLNYYDIFVRNAFCTARARASRFIHFRHLVARASSDTGRRRRAPHGPAA